MISVAGFLLTIMIGILVLYPLWEVIFLGKPTSDSVHDFHKFLESKILDKFRGKMAYLMSLIIFLVIYIVPVIILKFLLDKNFIQVALMWFLLFPLIFLQYFAANGTASGIIKRTYQSRIPKPILKNSIMGQSVIKKMGNWFVLFLAWIPFVMNLFNIARPLYIVLTGGVLIVPQGEPENDLDILMGFFSLFATLPFAIKGFFQKFWNRKSKTKTIDFLFAGYIFIGIGVNMLISFIKIDPSIVDGVLNTNPIVYQLHDLFGDPELLLPIIVIQSVITFTYGISVLMRPNTDFYADVRVQATTKAFGRIDINKLIRERQKQLEEAEDKDGVSVVSATKKKFNFLTLYKSLLLKPQYSKYGVDINQQVRFKAAQYLLLIALEDKEKAKQISEFVVNTQIKPFKDDDYHIEKNFYLSKEAIDLLGEIGEVYPEFVISDLIDSLSYSNLYLQKFVLDALGDIGEVKENLKTIIDNIHPLFKHNRYEVRQAALSAVTEMIVEGNSEDKEIVDYVLKFMYALLENVDNAPIIDTCLEGLVKMSSRIADDINIKQIEPFLKYNKAEDQDDNDFIQQNAIIVLSYLVYYNLSEFKSLIPSLKQYMEDSRFFIRYVTADALGNYILRGDEDQIQDILRILISKSLNDIQEDVAEMATESVAKFLIMRPGYKATWEGAEQSILDIYVDALKSSDKAQAEHASEALKLISPLYEENIYDALEDILKNSTNIELIGDCLSVIAESGSEEHLSVDLDLIYEFTTHKDPIVRSEAVRCLGYLAINRPEIKDKYIIDRLNDEDPQIRQEAIFSLGKLGINHPAKISQILIEKFFDMNRESEENIPEVELYSETLGIIGSHHPSNEIIITLQSALMGDTHPFAKDVVAKALGRIGEGMIKSGNATRSIENDAFYNHISWLRSSNKIEYTLGNIIIIFIEALQLKGIPDLVMNELSDSIQDLLPVFLFADPPKGEKEDMILETIKELLAQAYYSNYNSEILETIDRIDSLLSFKHYFQVRDPALKEQLLFYTKNYTPDAHQFYDQGMLFQILVKENKNYLQYALKSFEISVDLAPYEYFTPKALFQMGSILKTLGKFEEAKINLAQALEIFTSLDLIAEMKECDTLIAEMDSK
jgi:HEAT repeat protein